MAGLTSAVFGHFVEIRQFLAKRGRTVRGRKRGMGRVLIPEGVPVPGHIILVCPGTSGTIPLMSNDSLSLPTNQSHTLLLQASSRHGRPSKFSFHARYVLLTYSQCGDLDPFNVVGRLGELGAECIIGREDHQSGGIHLHCFADFGRKFRSRMANVFDVDNRHPNIEPSRGTPEKGYDYSIKDGDVVAGGLERPSSGTGGESGVRTSATNAIWTIITSAVDREEFWQLCEELDPFRFATMFPGLQKFADWRFRIIPTPYQNPDGITFVLPECSGGLEWVLQSGIGLGLSRVGK